MYIYICTYVSYQSINQSIKSIILSICIYIYVHFMYIYIYTSHICKYHTYTYTSYHIYHMCHTHTHTYVYIYIYTYHKSYICVHIYYIYKSHTCIDYRYIKYLSIWWIWIYYGNNNNGDISRAVPVARENIQVFGNCWGSWHRPVPGAQQVHIPGTVLPSRYIKIQRSVVIFSIQLWQVRYVHNC